MSMTRRDFMGSAAAFGGLSLAAGCVTPPPAPAEPVACAKKSTLWCRCCRPGRVALQMYSIRNYIKANGMAKALKAVADAGYEGVEFAGYFDHTAADLKAMLADNGLIPVSTHIHNSKYGFDTKNWKYDKDVLAKTCEFELSYGNSMIICPGGGNMPKGVKWSSRDSKPAKDIDYFIKRLCDFYNKAAYDAATYGCKIGLHNHQWEFFLKTTKGETFWDYFFSNTDERVQMEQDVGWTTCAGADPCEQYVKYPHRAIALHAKENSGNNPKKFDAILGKPGEPGAKGVDWDRLFKVTDADGVKWYIVECERHADSFEAVIPSFEFLKSKERV